PSIRRQLGSCSSRPSDPPPPATNQSRPSASSRPLRPGAPPVTAPLAGSAEIAAPPSPPLAEHPLRSAAKCLPTRRRLGLAVSGQSLALHWPPLVRAAGGTLRSNEQGVLTGLNRWRAPPRSAVAASTAPNELRSAGPRAALPVTLWNGRRGLRCNAWLGDALILKHHHTVMPRSLVHGAAFGWLPLHSFRPPPSGLRPLAATPPSPMRHRSPQPRSLIKPRSPPWRAPFRCRRIASDGEPRHGEPRYEDAEPCVGDWLRFK